MLMPRPILILGHLPAFIEDSDLADTAPFGIKSGEDDLLERLALGSENILLSDAIEVTASSQNIHDLSLERGEIQLPPAQVQAVGFIGKHLASGDIDEIDTTSHDEDVGLLRILFGDGMQLFGDVVHSTEKHGTIDPDDLQLGT